jgi:hypothetical protein
MAVGLVLEKKPLLRRATIVFDIFIRTKDIESEGQ